MPLDRTKLSLVLALLESDQDGEVVAAAKAIVRMLASVDMKPSELAQENILEQQQYALQRAGIAAAQRNLDRVRAQLDRERMQLEQERDRFYREQKGETLDETSQATVDQVKEFMRSTKEHELYNGYGGEPREGDPFFSETTNWTVRDRYHDQQREQFNNLNEGETEAWRKFARIDVKRAGWILGHRNINPVAAQCFVFAAKHGRLNHILQSTLDVYMRHQR